LNSRINVRESLLNGIDERRSSTQELRARTMGYRVKSRKIDNIRRLM
jgi:hypothetical protein